MTLLLITILTMLGNVGGALAYAILNYIVERHYPSMEGTGYIAVMITLFVVNSMIILLIMWLDIGQIAAFLNISGTYTPIGQGRRSADGLAIVIYSLQLTCVIFMLIDARCLTLMNYFTEKALHLYRTNNGYTEVSADEPGSETNQWTFQTPDSSV